MKDAERYEFSGSGIVGFIVFGVVLALRFFGIIEISWLLTFIIAFVGSAVVCAIISTIVHCK